MFSKSIELGPIRPVAEAKSLLIRTTRGCPWNRCHFCVNYHGMDFSIRSLDDILKDIDIAKENYGDHPFESCFLQDGDSFIMKTSELLIILKALKENFPTLERITSYGRAATMVSKSLKEMKEISAAGLNRLYCGFESGSDIVLKNVDKGTTSKELIKSGTMAKEAGMEISEFVIMGLGGKDLWEEHAVQTARVLNEIDPDFIRVRTIGVKEGSGLEVSMELGQYRLQSEEEIIIEQRKLLEGLTNVTSYYSNDHAVNLLVEVEGRLPDDKEKMLSIIDTYLDLSPENKEYFNLGRRLGYIIDLDDVRNNLKSRSLEYKINRLREESGLTIDETCHALREQIV